MRLRSRALLMQLERACFESAALSWLRPSVGGRMLKAQKLKAWYNLCCSHSYLVKLAHFAGGQCCDRSSLALIPLRPDWPTFSGGLAHASPSDNSMCTLLTWLMGGRKSPSNSQSSRVSLWHCFPLEGFLCLLSLSAKPMCCGREPELLLPFVKEGISRLAVNFCFRTLWQGQARVKHQSWSLSYNFGKSVVRFTAFCLFIHGHSCNRGMACF